MGNKVALVILIIAILLFSCFAVKLGVQIYNKEIDMLNERMDLLEKMILNNKTIDALSLELDEAAVVLSEHDNLDQVWLNWIAQNMWIVEVDWGE